MIELLLMRNDAAALLTFSGGKLRQALSLGVGDSLARIQEIHKKQVIKRGGGKTVPDTFIRRTGELARSYTIDWRQGKLSGSYGSYLRRAVIMEKGGTIKAKNAKYLTIPTKAVKKMRRARDYPDLFVVHSGRLMFLAREKGSGIEPMFWLKRKVTLPARPTLKTAVEMAGGDVDRIFDRSSEEGIGL